MSEKMLRNVFIVGTLLFLLILGAMTVDSLTQVVSARTAQLTDQVVAGKQVWQSKNCNDCHTILGIGGYYAPELTKTFNRRGGPWLTAYLKDPQKTLPGAMMQDQKLTDAQAADLVAFFKWVSLIDTNNWPPQPLNAVKAANVTAPSTAPQAPASAASSSSASAQSSPSLSGAAVYNDKFCSTCHVINGQGGRSGPDLSHIATTPHDGLGNSADALLKYLENPQAQKPDALMPAIPMTAAEREALVQYMLTLK